MYNFTPNYSNNAAPPHEYNKNVLTLEIIFVTHFLSLLCVNTYNVHVPTLKGFN